MPNLSAAVLKDSANADHTFTPNDIQGGVATLVESTGVPIGDKRLTISRNQTAQGRRKVTMKLAIPKIEDAVVNGVSRPGVTRAAYADITMTFDPASTSVERRDVLAFVRTLMGNGMIDSVVGDLQGLY
jgi:hypothetical protein